MHFGMGQSTIRKFLRAPVFPERAQTHQVRRQARPVSQTHPRALGRREADMKLLLAELKTRGYTGSLSHLL